MSAEGSSTNSLPDEPSRVFFAKRPASNSSREIRDAILVDEFGFTPIEIRALTAFNDKLFYIRHIPKDGKSSAKFAGRHKPTALAAKVASRHQPKEDWATVTEVAGWPTNINGELSIPVKERVIKDVLTFHERYVKLKIGEAVVFISDPQSRSEVLKDLLNILNSSGNDRLASMYDVINDTKTSQRSAAEISRAVSYLTNRAGYENNPFLNLIKANSALTEYQNKSGPGFDLNALALVNEATRKTTFNYIKGGVNPAATLSRTEAATINRQLALMYSELGKDTEFLEREWSARFYDLSDENRSMFEEGDLIELSSAKAAKGLPRRATAAVRQLWDVTNAREEKVRQEEVTDKIGSQVVPTDHRNDQYFQRSTDGYSRTVVQNNNIRGTNFQPRFKVVQRNVSVFSAPNMSANALGAGLDLPLRTIKYGVTLRRLDEVTEYLNTTEKLIREIRGQNQTLVPMRPEKVKELIKQVQRYGRVTTGSNEKLRVQMTLAQLERLWEVSNAAWGRQRN